MTCVLGEDRPAGRHHHGRRLAPAHGRPGLLAQPASAVMTSSPRPSGVRAAVEALALMEQRKITSLVVVDADARVEGGCHLHDLWRTQMF